MKARTLLAALLLAMAAPAAAADLKAEIQAANERFDRAFNKGDAAALAALYTEQANILPPGKPMATGRAAIQSFWQGAISSGAKNISLTALNVQQDGDAAREIGHFSFDASTEQKIEGKYVVVWKHQRDGWKLDTDIWNTDK